MDSKALKMLLAIAPSDDKALIDLLLQSHETQLRHARESVTAEGGNFAWSVRSLFFREDADGSGFSLSGFWGEVV